MRKPRQLSNRWIDAIGKPRLPGVANHIVLFTSVLCLLLGAMTSFVSSALAAAPEAPVTEAASEITATTATLNGELNPGASGKAGYYFVYNKGSSCTGGMQTSLPAEVEGEKEEQAIKVSTPVTGLEGSTEYTVCLVATNELGGTTLETVPNEVSFKTAGAPVIENQSVSGVTPFEAMLEAVVNPGGGETTCEVRYGKTEALEATPVPCPALNPLGNAPASAT